MKLSDDSARLPGCRARVPGDEGAPWEDRRRTQTGTTTRTDTRAGSRMQRFIRQLTGVRFIAAVWVMMYHFQAPLAVMGLLVPVVPSACGWGASASTCSSRSRA